MIIDDDILETTCKDMIETILLCLPDSTKGTIYLVGPMPQLRAMRVTSGIRQEGSDEIRWGLPEDSDYNHPGKRWDDYKDMPGRPLEAMGWCVEKQKSWTADDPNEDRRSVSKQINGSVEDFHHMEPVLVKKSSLFDSSDVVNYPLDFQGNPIWQSSDYVVGAVVKIHFKPGAIRRGAPATKIIKKLARTLGTELISQRIREAFAEAQKTLARERLQSCNVLAHELRNTLIKLGFIFTAINVEISYLREQWEAELERALPGIGSKKAILEKLNKLVQSELLEKHWTSRSRQLGQHLMAEQRELADLPLLPSIATSWVEKRIKPKWQELLLESDSWKGRQDEVLELLVQLEEGMGLGMDENLARQVHHLPEDLRTMWPRIAYVDFTVEKRQVLEDVLKFLDHPDLDIPHKYQSKRILTALKALAETIPEIEEKANRIMLSLRNGHSSRECLDTAD